MRRHPFDRFAVLFVGENFFGFTFWHSQFCYQFGIHPEMFADSGPDIGSLADCFGNNIHGAGQSDFSSDDFFFFVNILCCQFQRIA